MITFSEIPLNATFSLAVNGQLYLKSGATLARRYPEFGYNDQCDGNAVVYDVKTEAQRNEECLARLAEEYAEKVAADAEFRALAASVGRLVGMDLQPAKEWDTGRPQLFWAALKGQGMDIVLRTREYGVGNDRIEAYGLTDKRATAHIKFSSAKSAAAIAKDITNRLMPRYRMDLEADGERVAAERAWEAKERATKEAMALEFRAGNSARFANGEAEISGDRVRLTLRDLDAKTARLVMDLVAEMRAEGARA